MPFKGPIGVLYGALECREPLCALEPADERVALCRERELGLDLLTNIVARGPIGSLYIYREREQIIRRLEIKARFSDWISGLSLKHVNLIT